MREKFNIVIADDDLDDQQLIRDALNNSKVNISIYTVNDGIQLLDLLHKRYKFSHVTETPDLILLDLNMPLMDGFDALRQIKFNLLFRNIPVYIVTTSRNPKDREQALAMGASGFYSKGASSKDIQKIIQQVCLDCFA